MRSRRRTVASLTLTAGLVLGSFASAGAALAVGTCKGNAIEYVLPAEQQDPGLTAYDQNHDGVICVATKGRRTVYSDNRP